MEAFVFCDLLADLAAEFRQQYVDEQEVLNNERETLRVDDIGEKSTPEKESIDEVDLRRKPRNWFVFKNKTFTYSYEIKYE